MSADSACCVQLDYVVGSELVFEEDLIPPLMAAMNTLVTPARLLARVMQYCW